MTWEYEERETAEITTTPVREDGGPWRGPTLEEWLKRINDGACRLEAEGAGGEWTLPWIER